MKQPRVDPRIIIGIGVFFTSFSSILIRLTEAPAIATAANRMIITTVLLFPLLIHERVTTPRDRQQVPTLRVTLICIGSGFALALHFFAWITSLDLTTIASATVIVNTHPIVVVVAGFLIFGERVSPKTLVWMGVTLAGGALLSSGDISLGAEALKGDFLALLGAITVAGYFLIGRYARRHVSTRVYGLLVYGSSAIFLVIFALIARTPVFGYSVKDYLLFAAMALFCTILGHTLFNWALKYLKTSFVSTIILGEPVFATLLGMGIFGELPPALTIAGGSVMLVGLVGFVRAEGRARRSTKTAVSPSSGA